MKLRKKLQIKNVILTRAFFLALLATFVSSLLIGGLGYFTKYILDKVGMTPILAFWFTVISIFVSVAVFLRNYAWGNLAATWNGEILEQFRVNVSDNLVRDKTTIQSLLGLLIEKSYEFFFHHANACTRFALVSIFSFFAILSLNSTIALTSLVAMMVSAILIGLIFRIAIGSQGKFREAQLQFMRRSNQILEGQEDILSLGRREFLSFRLHEYISDFFPRLRGRFRQSSALQAAAIFVVLVAGLCVGLVTISEIHDETIGHILGVGLSLGSFVVSVVALVSVGPRALETWFELTDLFERFNSCYKLRYSTVIPDCAQSMSGERILVEQLVKRYEELEFRFSKVEFKRGLTFLIGQNGSGKTTFLRCLAGLDRADELNVLLGDQAADLFQLQSRVAYLDSEPKVFEGSATDNLLLSASDLKSIKVVESLLQESNIDLSFLNKLPEEMSSGEKQILNVLRGILSPKPILILDESLNSVAEPTQRRLFERLAHSGKIVIAVTHSLGLVSGRVIKISDFVRVNGQQRD